MMQLRKQRSSQGDFESFVLALRQFFLLPWWMFLCFFGVLIGLSFMLHNDAAHKEQLGLERAQMEKPPAVDVADFRHSTDVHALGEVNVHAHLTPRYSKKIRDRNQYSTGTGTKSRYTDRYMYPLFSARDGAASNVVHGVVLLLPYNQKKAFEERLNEVRVGSVDGATIFEINGIKGRQGRFEDTISRELRSAGLVKADGFVVIEPFLMDREAAMTEKFTFTGSHLFAYLTLYLAFGAAFVMFVKLAIAVRKARPARPDRDRYLLD